MKIILKILFLLPFYGHTGEVVFIRGEVLLKTPTTKDKILLKKGDFVKDNSLVYTSKKGFARIKFEDNSMISIAPSSKILLKEKTSIKPRVLDLIIGQISGSFSKSRNFVEGHKHKLYIETSSAVLGVRGTQFVATYNDKNHSTSNTTLNGEVDIYKKQDKDVLESLRQSEGDLFDEIADYDETIDLRDQLGSYSTKAVLPGTFSSAKFNYNEAIDPVRISRDQLNVIKKKKFSSKMFIGTSVMKNPRKQTEDGTRHGGYVDFNSGLYIEPPKDAEFDNMNGVYKMPKELGGINLATGDYSPPKGLVLDPLMGFTQNPHLYSERNVSENLKKLTKLDGTLDERLSESIKILKHITRTDYYGYIDLKQTTRVLENYYGEYRSVTESPAFFLEAQSYGGIQLYHSKKYLFYMKGNLKGEYYDSDNKEVQKNNKFEFMGGGEFHRKLAINGKKAKLIFDIKFRKQYMNRELNDEYLPFTEDTSFAVKNVFSFNKDHHSTVFYEMTYFQGFEERNHGKINKVGFHHKFNYDGEYDVLTGADYSIRSNQENDDNYHISRIHLKGVKKNFFYKTNLVFGGVHEWHDSDVKFPFNKSIFKRAEFKLDRSLGNFWKINASYMYEDQETENDLDERNFNRHVYGLGLTMYF